MATNAMKSSTAATHTAPGLFESVDHRPRGMSMASELNAGALVEPTGGHSRLRALLIVDGRLR
jgi:hypothetical protein